MCRNRSHPWNLTLPTSRNKRIHYWCLGARHHRTPPDDLWPCLYGLEPFRLHKGNLHIIKQVADQCMYVLCMYLSEVFTFLKLKTKTFSTKWVFLDRPIWTKWWNKRGNKLFSTRLVRSVLDQCGSWVLRRFVSTLCQVSQADSSCHPQHKSKQQTFSTDVEYLVLEWL